MAKDCSRCGNKLDRDEAESPREDEDGDAICDDCYHDKYEFTCCDCCEYGHVDDQHKILVVFEAVRAREGGDIEPGIYRIVGGPYHGGPMIGEGYLFRSSLNRIAAVNPGMDGQGYPCGHLCAECQGHVNAQRKAKCSVCKTMQESCLRVKLGSWKDFEFRVYQWTRPKIVCAACRHAHRGAWKRLMTATHEIPF